MKTLNLQNIGILAGAVAVGYLLYVATRPGGGSGYTATSAAKNTDGQFFIKTFQDDSALTNDFGMIST